MVSPNVDMRERRVESQAVRDGAKTFGADVVVLEREPENELKKRELASYHHVKANDHRSVIYSTSSSWCW